MSESRTVDPNAEAKPNRNALFRKEALERLQSPEQLDQVMRVTRPSGWLALIALFMILAAAFTWSILGHIPTKVHGQGIFMRVGGVFLPVSMASGTVVEIYPKVGELISKDQPVARIDMPLLQQKVEFLRARLAEIENEQDLSQGFSSKELELQQKAFEAQRARLNEQSSSIKQKIYFLEEKVRAHKELVQQGLITNQSLYAAKQELVNAKDELKQVTDSLNQIEVKEKERLNSAEGGTLKGKIKIEEARRELLAAEQELELKQTIKSPYAGRVVELLTDTGNLINPGKPVLSVEKLGQKLQAVVYVSPNDGKKVHPGMTIHLSPSTVKKEEYGLLIAKVTRVSDYPSTHQGMMALLENERLVEMFSANGPPIAVHAELEVDHYTDSGYKWTSGEGPPTRIEGGTTTVGSVTVEGRTPISLVIPYLKQKLGL